MSDAIKGILITVGAGLVLAILLGGGNFVIETQSRLAVIEKAVVSMEKNLDRLVDQGRKR